LGIQYADLLTPSLAHSLLTPGTSQSLGLSIDQEFATEGGARHSPTSKRPRTAAVAALPSAAAFAPPAMLPPAGPSSVAACVTTSHSNACVAAGPSAGVGSTLRKKRPPGATDLVTNAAPGTIATTTVGGEVLRTSGVDGVGESLASALGSGGCLSGCLSGFSFSGLETPQELKQFAAQLSPHIGVAPSTMLEFLANETQQ